MLGGGRVDDDVDDLADLSLTSLTVEHIISILEARYGRDYPYTDSGVLTLSINPCRPMPQLYDENMQQKYIEESVRNAQREGREQQARKVSLYLRQLPPHIYKIGDAAYSKMKQHNQPQVLLVSGESGAGKTEATKYIVGYIVRRSLEDKPTGKGQSNLREMIFHSNPILEAFGNAKTLANNNSSRFGKLFRMLFTQEGEVIGAQIETFLLEKSRVAAQLPQERNFHVFYMLLTGASAEERSRLGLGKTEDYDLIAKAGCTTIVGVDEAQRFKDLREAFNTCGLEQQFDGIMAILASILHLGNLKFDANQGSEGVESASVEPDDSLRMAAELLHLQPEVLRRNLTMKQMRSGARGTAYHINLTVSACIDARNALIRSTYARMFDWLVIRLNERFRPSGELSKYRTVSVLDIFGFERFEQNNFEQLCINYANEMLHQQMLDRLLKSEIKAFEEEGLDVGTFNFMDNARVLQLVEGVKPAGIISIIQEEASLSKGSDESLAQKLITMLKDHPNFAKPHPKFGSTAFIVKHFAGDVRYNTTGFMTKNRDVIGAELEAMCDTAPFPLLNDIFELPSTEEDLTGGTAGRKRMVTVAQTFRKQLQSLQRLLSESELHFVRCLKPNAKLEAGEFDNDMIKGQLVNMGVSDLLDVFTRVRYWGYRQKYSFFRGQLLGPSEEFWDRKTELERNKQATQLMLNGQGVKSEFYMVGKTTLFGREQAELVIKAYLKRRLQAVIFLQSRVRQVQARKQFVKMRALVLNARSAIVRVWRRGHIRDKFRATSAAILKYDRASKILGRYVRTYFRRQRWRAAVLMLLARVHSAQTRVARAWRGSCARVRMRQAVMKVVETQRAAAQRRAEAAEREAAEIARAEAEAVATATAAAAQAEAAATAAAAAAAEEAEAATTAESEAVGANATSDSSGVEPSDAGSAGGGPPPPSASVLAAIRGGSVSQDGSSERRRSVTFEDDPVSKATPATATAAGGGSGASDDAGDGAGVGGGRDGASRAGAGYGPGGGSGAAGAGEDDDGRGASSRLGHSTGPSALAVPSASSDTRLPSSPGVALAPTPMRQRKESPYASTLALAETFANDMDEGAAAAMAALRNSLLLAEVDADTLRARFSVAEEELDKLMRKHAEEARRADVAHASALKLESALREREAFEKELLTRNAELERRLDWWRTQHETLVRRGERKSEQIQETATATHSLVTRLSQENEESRSAVTSLESRCVQATSEISRQRSELADLRERLAREETAHQKTRMLQTAAEQAAKESERARALLSASNASLAEKNSTLQGYVDVLEWRQEVLVNSVSPKQGPPANSPAPVPYPPYYSQ